MFFMLAGCDTFFIGLAQAGGLQVAPPNLPRRILATKNRPD
jgi:hypothetical protein